MGILDDLLGGGRLKNDFEDFVKRYTQGHPSEGYSDKEVIDEVVSALDDGPVPDVITIYVTGSDLFAHVANDGPDTARRTYLHEVIDPLISRLHEVLAQRDALAHRYIVVSADHGHTAVEHDEQHALGAGDPSPPAAVVQTAGY